MAPELGHFALILALNLALAQTLFPLAGTLLRLPHWSAVARSAAVGQLVFMSLAYACLTYAFVTNDFSVKYVVDHSNSHLPLIYRIVSVWGGHEGSLLLWNLLLSFWTVAVVLFSRSLPLIMTARVVAVMGFISIGFLVFMLTTSNPFARFVPMPADGNDLNPLLQDPGLILHPPLLYMGYVGFSVAFAFAIAALIGGNLDSAWARWSRPWTLIAWVFLTLGIALGSWWAYYELGWGGWWFWDPVENASFMPWLVGTALIHSLAVTEKRSAFKNWTVLLAIIAFSLSLLGTFLVRSGVLTSVHAFATDPKRGVFILAFLSVVVGSSLLLYAWRAPRMGMGNYFAPVSRESLLLINNVLLVVAAACILLGTLYPLFLDALNLGKISVGSPYFGRVFFWLMAPLTFLLGFGLITRWKQDQVKNILKQIKIGLGFSIGLGLLVPLLIIGKQGLLIAPGVAMATWIIFMSIQAVGDRFKHQTYALPLSLQGALLAHCGVALFIIGVTVSGAYSVEKEVRLEPNKPLTVADYQFIFSGTTQVKGPNYEAEQGLIKVFKGTQEIATLHPQKRIYWTQNMPMTEAAIDPGLTRDIYVALGEPLDAGAWSARLYYKPFIRWIWLGALLMALGGILSASDKRYRLPLKRRLN